MKLYHSTASPNSRRVRMFMAEKGISIPLQPVNLAEKEQFSDGFKAINPRQQVPVLVLDDGTAIAEVPAIWRFLEESHPERPLLGSDATAKALVAMWERRAELDGFAPTMEGVRNSVPGLKGRALRVRTITSRLPGWSTAASAASRIFMPTSTPDSRMCPSWPAPSSQPPTSPPS
jgi:glutathione S-transferase